MSAKHKPVHPGNVLKEDVLAPLGLTVTEAATDLGVSRKALSELINEKPEEEYLDSIFRYLLNT